MENLGFLHFKNEDVTIHYINIDGKIYGLSLNSFNNFNKLKNSSIVQVIPGHTMEEFYANKDNFSEFLLSSINNISDSDFVKNIFDIMLTNNFTFFKEWNTDMVVLEFLLTDK